MTIIHELISLYNSLPEDSVYSGVIICIIKNLHRIAGMSLEQVAEMCGVSTITISRLIKKLSCGSFRSFRDELTEIVDAYPRYNRVIPIQMLDHDDLTGSYFDCVTERLDTLHKDLDQETIDRACELLHTAEDIHLCDLYSIGHAKRQLQVDLFMDGKRATCHSRFSGDDEWAVKAGKDTLVVVTMLAAYRNYAQMNRMLKEFHKKGIRMIIIASDSTPKGIDSYADCVLKFRGIDSAADNILVDSIYNVLCLNYRARYID